MKHSRNIHPKRSNSIKLMEEILATNMGNRYSSSGEEYQSSNTDLIVRGDLFQSVQVLANSKRIAIITGFYLAEVDSIETDGPLAAILLAQYFISKGNQCTLITDSQCYDHLVDTISSIKIPIPVKYCSNDICVNDYDCILIIERLGPSINGLHYSARCTKVEVKNDEVIQFLTHANQKKIPTIGVGDGGNEIGMGKIYEKLIHYTPNGTKIGCIIPTDFLIFTGISNWCYWAWLAILDPDYLTSTSWQKECNLLKKIVQVGLVDGMTFNRTLTVDAVPFEEQIKIRNQLLNLANR